MSYLLDKKLKRNKYQKYMIFVFILIIFFYFRSSIFAGFSYALSFVFNPILVIGNNIGDKFSSFGSYFYSKNSLFQENKNLKEDLDEIKNRIINYNSLLDENIKLKEIFGRKEEKSNMILATILAKPNQSPYDTLIIDIGEKNGIVAGQKVFALGDVPIGSVAQVYLNTAKVILYSTPKETTEVIISGRDTYMQVVGRGAGNFEMILPREFILEKGTEVVLPGVRPRVLALVETIISDPRDSYQKALLISPVNIFELKFVQVEK